MNFGEMKTEMGSWLAVDEDRLPAATRGAVINICVKELLRKYELRFGEHSSSLATQVGKADYEIPTDWSRPFLFFYIDPTSGKPVPVNYLTREEFLKKFGSNQDRGTPANFTIWGGKFYFGPCPNSILTIYYDYYRYLPDLVDAAPGNENIFTKSAWEVIFFRSLWYAAKFLIGDPAEAIWERAAKDFEGQLMREHSRAAAMTRRPVSNEQ